MIYPLDSSLDEVIRNRGINKVLIDQGQQCHILVLLVLDNITNLFVHFPVCTIKTYNFVYIILSYVFLHLHTIPMHKGNNKMPL